MTPEYQCCPVCNGCGRAMNFDNPIPTTMDLCTVCGGKKIIERPRPAESDAVAYKRNCDNCKTETFQTVELYNPDNPDEGEVWRCSVCKENTDWVST